jgi:hypothetical protein
MSKSPLSGAFADSSATTKKKNKKNGAILLIAGIALTSSIGGVFAANSITINSGSAIEFGQGVAATTSCEAAITTSMTQSYVTGTTFRVGNVVLSNVDGATCNGKDLKVTLVDSSSAEITSTLIRAATGTTSYTWDASSANVTADVVRNITVTTQNAG